LSGPNSLLALRTLRLVIWTFPTAIIRQSLPALLMREMENHGRNRAQTIGDELQRLLSTAGLQRRTQK
jgi:hypothetical protein